MVILTTLISAVLGAIVYRVRGMTTKIPKPTLQFVFGLPYAAVCWPVIGVGAILVAVVTTFTVWTGHGNGQDLGTWSRKDLDGDERLEFLIKWAYGKIPEYWYDFILLGITGVAVTLLPGIIIQSPLLVLSGFLKPVAYAIGFKYGDRLKLAPTEIGETLTGFFMWGTLAFITSTLYL